MIAAAPLRRVKKHRVSHSDIIEYQEPGAAAWGWWGLKAESVAPTGGV
jgi:hypothetical protein